MGELTLYRAQVRSWFGRWIDGGLFVVRDDAERSAAQLAVRFGSEARVVDEVVTPPHPSAGWEK